MKTYLIDYENVNSGGLTGIDRLKEDDRVIIFYSEKCNTLTFDAHRKIGITRAAVEYHKAPNGRKNSLDFQLSTYLGYLLAREPERDYIVVSHDEGYRSALRFWRFRNYSVTMASSIGAPALSDEALLQGQTAPVTLQPSQMTPTPPAPVQASPVPVQTVTLQAAPSEAAPAGEAENAYTVAEAMEEKQAETEAAAVETAVVEAAVVEAAVVEAAKPAREARKRPAARQRARKAKTQAAPSQDKPVQAVPSQAAPSQAAPTEAAPMQDKPVQAAPVQAAPAKAEGGNALTAMAKAELAARLTALLPDCAEEDINRIATCLKRCHTKQTVNNSLVRSFGNDRTSVILKAIRPLLAGMKGSNASAAKANSAEKTEAEAPAK